MCGCETSQKKDRTVLSIDSKVEEVEIKGHLDLIFDGHYKGNIIHAEHCPCKISK